MEKYTEVVFDFWSLQKETQVCGDERNYRALELMKHNSNISTH